MPDLLTYDVFDFTQIRDVFEKHGERRRFKRGDYFCRFEQPAREIAVVDAGAFSFSRPDLKGRDQILSMAFVGELVGAVVPLRPGRCSASDVRALCKSELLVMPYAEWKAEMESCNPDFYRQLLEAVAFGFMMRAISYRCDTPEQRYLELLSRIPDVRKLIPMSSIASYLGLSREAFSRMRSKIKM